MANYRLQNKEKAAKAMREWRAKNKERELEIARESRKKNLHIRMANNGIRRAISKQATPSWANKFFISEAYDLAKLRTNETGIKWEVDHIVPLKSNIVCGLHTYTNIRVITKKENLEKRNYVWPDMPLREVA